MARWVMVLAAGAGCVAAVAGVFLPPGYQQVVRITNDNLFNWRPKINNRGQVVFVKWLDPWNENTCEICLYDNGRVTRLTYDNIHDNFPDINDAGEIVWSRAIGANGTFEIVLYRDGQLTRLTNDALHDYAPKINNQGTVAWYKYTNQGCAGADTVIYLYDGNSAHPITSGGWQDCVDSLNDLGDLVWTRYNQCVYPWRAQIFLRYSTGEVIPLTDDQNEPQLGVINNRRVVVWQHCIISPWSEHIMRWENGVTTEVTDWGRRPVINNRGDIAFIRWHESSRTWQVWLCRNGEFYQITSDPFWNCDADMDDGANMVWSSGPIDDADILLLKRFPPGDANCDGFVNAFDIDLFVAALTQPDVYSGCDITLADVNFDGAVNTFDIDPFVDLLTE